MAVRHRLIALDPDDLAAVSAHLQNAIVRVADMVWRPGEKRLVMGLQHDQALPGADQPQRVISALRFDRALACQSRNIDLAAGNATLDLLGIEFLPADPPGGTVLLMFAGGGVLRLDVECLECELADIGSGDPVAAAPVDMHANL